MSTDKDAIMTLMEKSFAELDGDARAMISDNGEISYLTANEVALRSGKYLNYIMLVARGALKVYRENDAEEDIFLYYLEPGKACALSLVCASRRETSKVMIIAETDSTVISVPVQVMEILMRTNKSWYQFVVETYRYRFDDLLSAFDSIVFKKLDERLLEYLNVCWQKNEGRPLGLTHQQIADDLHSTREVISRLLKKMEQSGMIVMRRNQIVLA